MKASLNFLHHQGNDWLRELEFYKDELALLNNRLGNVTKSNTSQEVMAQVEHFQNKFILLREQLDILKHDVSEELKNIEELTKSKPEHTNEKSVESNDGMLERVKDFSSSISNTRFEFNKFLAGVL